MTTRGNSGARWPVMAALLLLAVVNILPLLLNTVGGDMVVRFVMNECFSQQFWQGDIYPRWCFDGNTGLGAPFFVFYFPLPHYIAALLYPLGAAGVGDYHQFALSFFLATLLTAATSYGWLRLYARPLYALLGAAVYLFIPYRMEVMLYRAAYGELWLMAFLPLMFMACQQLLHGVRGAVWKLALAVGLCLLSHVPGTIIALGVSGLVMLVAARSWRARVGYAAGVLWGIGLAAFYVLPAAHYKQFVRTDIMSDPERVWANVFPTWRLIEKMQLWHPVIMMVLSIAACAVLVGITLYRRKLLAVGLQREVLGWAVACMAGLTLLLPLSKPLYGLMGSVGEMVFPWRMQLAFALAIPFFFVLWLEWLMAPARLKTLKHDMAMLMGFLVFFAYFQLFTYAGDDADAAIKKTVAGRIYTAEEYQTRWTDAAHFNDEYMDARYRAGKNLHRLVVKDESKAMLTDWGWRGIHIQTKSNEPLTLQLDHFYFPVWEARLETGEKLNLLPRQPSGRMELHVPAGNHQIAVTYAVAGREGVGRMSALASIIALVLLGFAAFRGRSKMPKKF